ncbi:MAG: molecular chaperone TorD family protein [Desulfurococcales archaeon]|nr:molecular chaperone TorD family protein [Desulfurococcales archaeon]
MEQHYTLQHPTFFLGLSNLYRLMSQILLAGMNLSQWPSIETLPEETLKLLEPLIKSVRSGDTGDIEGLRESLCRRDLDKSTRLLWPRVMEQAYQHHGYTVSLGRLGPDHLAIQLAFTAQLLYDAANALSAGDRESFMDRLVAAHRFLTTHIIPTITQCNSKVAGSMRPIIQLTLSSIRPLVIRLARAKTHPGDARG